MPNDKIPFETLIADLHGPDWTRRCDAARLLGKSRDPRAVDALLPDLEDKDWRVRRNAVQALGALKSARAVETLLKALNDRVMTVRQRAAVALGRIKDPAVIPALVRAVTTNSGSDAGYAAYQALRKFGKKAAPLAAQALQETPHIYLIDLLGEAQLPAYADLLIGLARHENLLIRTRAVAALGQMQSPEAIRFLIEALGGEDGSIKASAVQSLGRLGAVEAIPALLNLLQNDSIYGTRSGIYHAITDAFQDLSGIKSDLKQAFPMGQGPSMSIGPAGISLPEAASQMDSEALARLNQMLAGMEERIHDIGVTLNLPPERVLSLQDRTWQFGAMFQDARDASQERVKLLLQLLADESPLKRAAAALTLPWYANRLALGPLEEAQRDADETVRRAAQWAHAALEAQLGIDRT